MSGEIRPVEVERGDHRYIQYIVANGHSDARASLCTSGIEEEGRLHGARS